MTEVNAEGTLSGIEVEAVIIRGPNHPNPGQREDQGVVASWSADEPEQEGED
jgi:hypothetical protein